MDQDLDSDDEDEIDVSKKTIEPRVIYRLLKSKQDHLQKNIDTLTDLILDLHKQLMLLKAENCRLSERLSQVAEEL